MKIAKYVSECPLCEEDIKVGDNILFSHHRGEWHHFQCPWQSDEGYRPDMIQVDVPQGAENIMEHEKNKWRDRPSQKYFRPISQPAGEPPVEKKIPAENNIPVIKRIVNFIRQWLGY